MNTAMRHDLTSLLGPEGLRQGEEVRPYLRDSTEFGPAEASLQRSIKALFDPKGLFNPGKKMPRLP